MNNNLSINQDHSRQGGAMIETESQRAIQEVQAAMIIAKRFPRDVKAALDRILNSCTRVSLAEQALYTYSRGGTDISGPSIRLAEAVAQQWGNLQFGIRELEQRNGESTVEAFAWDLETNTRQVKVFQVAHERHTRQGVKNLTDPRDIYELVANQGARRLRACILGVIPGDVIDEAVNQCDATLSASADTSPDAQKKILEAFAAYNVSKAQIEKKIQRRIDAITPAQVISLRKILLSMRDGMSASEDWFEAVAGVNASSEPAKVVTGAGTPAPAAKAKPAAKATAEKPAPEPEPQPDAEETPAMPDRAKMIADLRTSYRAAGIKQGIEAEDLLRKAGLLPEKEGLSAQKDAVVFGIWQKRDELFVAFPETPATEGTPEA